MASLTSGTLGGSLNGSAAGLGVVAPLRPGSSANDAKDEATSPANSAAIGAGAVVTFSDVARRLAAASGIDGSDAGVGAATTAIGAATAAGATANDRLAANATPGVAPVFASNVARSQGAVAGKATTPTTVNDASADRGGDATAETADRGGDATAHSAKSATSTDGSKGQGNAKAESVTTSGKTQNLTPEQQAAIEKMKARDREVRAHEQAHKSVGGGLAGAISLTTEQGPDGQSYAVGGSVPIDVTPVKGDADATIRKMQKVQAAALAPADPSGPDLQVAAAAAAYMAEAVKERSQNKNADPSEQKPGKVSATFHVSA